MKKVTFINKYAGSNDVARSTHQERKQINERNREHRGPGRSRNTKVAAETCRGTASGPITRRTPSHLEGLEVTVHRTAKTNPVHITSSLHIIPVGPGNTADPFDTASVPINSSVLRLLRYYKELYYRALWARVHAVLDGKFNKDIIERCSPEHVILECMESRSRMNSLLADIGCHLSKDVGIDPALNSLQLLQRGTASLRAEFRSKSSNVDCDILLDALHLYLAAVALDQQDATRAHAAGVKAIIKHMVEEGVPIGTARAGMLALVDSELSFQLLSRHLGGISGASKTQ
ncbi:hypothetical protein LTR70_009454 [Exophiala xenobiotica]|uniref:Uncharacterized protein n=1 Tax=Lithohypha guttulata TaxID=1690604 RepID=A0ABR0JZI3_9EURO|nr:hypothetical protein LTR24_009223 [Lithohypha guttulata]KAK5310462.1 hypothetical protein LTR70_009454 [Exophiala xenobiotica]